MSFTKSKATVSVTEITPYAAHCDLYLSRLDMVLSEIEHGALGDGTWGSEAHKTALQGVKLKIDKLLERMAESFPPTSKLHSTE